MDWENRKNLENMEQLIRNAKEFQQSTNLVNCISIGIINKGAIITKEELLKTSTQNKHHK